ncbi:MAG TPA: hypothetical protein VKA95_10155 [Nitrososphaeraceae archaeon]|nr:hypothetical protein [Nitrososphaeraceae archaeon]
MRNSLDEKFPYYLDVIAYDHYPSDTLDHCEVKTWYNTLDNQVVRRNQQDRVL